MLLRIFGSDNDLKQLRKIEKLLAKEMPAWTVEFHHSIRWNPTLTTPVADCHLHVDTPIRLAIPWARYNSWACYTGKQPNGWRFATTEMNEAISLLDLMKRTGTLPSLQRLLRIAEKNPTEPKSFKKFDPLASDSPRVGVITLTRNRKAWWGNMLQNLMKQTYFKGNPSNVEWLIVDDSDEGQDVSEEVAALKAKIPIMRIEHLRVTPGTPIGTKRNMAAAAADPRVQYFVNMDDDDHYPPESIERRIGFLSPATQIVYCSTIPMYDLTRYISAMNVPELDVGPAERVSEATLAFTREAWTTRPFPDVSMGEGEGFLMGRESQSMEIPSTGVIVSFIHTKNTSDRRVPAEQEPNGCHYGFSDEFFRYVHETGMAP